ncbi:hypothetical protein EYF80_017855 [Liparis tanakae]|uniref:Uncharacterized protein n=1 Tax=Liparis tanakae TaxID=230148 RepID=A0A4Z2I1P9_9TELE|nr:hypothetical protein EYF80_017855 [Liparis tanakae]
MGGGGGQLALNSQQGQDAGVPAPRRREIHGGVSVALSEQRDVKTLQTTGSRLTRRQSMGRESSGCDWSSKLFMHVVTEAAPRGPPVTPGVLMGG